MRWVRFHSPSCASMRRRSSSCWRESSSKASCSLQFNVLVSRLCRPLLLLRVLGPSCASMRRRARPCASIRVHAVQCTPMRLLVGPGRFTPWTNHRHAMEWKKKDVFLTKAYCVYVVYMWNKTIKTYMWRYLAQNMCSRVTRFTVLDDSESVTLTPSRRMTIPEVAVPTKIRNVSKIDLHGH